MKQNRRCIYCGYTIGNTKEHIIPKSLLADLRLYTHDFVEPPKYNIAPCCSFCNGSKSNKVLLPTPGHLATSLVNVPTSYIVDLADWVTTNRHKLRTFFEKDEHVALYGVELYEIDTVVTLYFENYYERLSDVSRNIPNNPFKREYLSTRQYGLSANKSQI